MTHPKRQHAYLTVEYDLTPASATFARQLTRLLRQRFNVRTNGTGVQLGARRTLDVGFAVRRSLAELRAIEGAIERLGREQRVNVRVDVDARGPAD
jgi:hypothetical protein